MRRHGSFYPLRRDIASAQPVLFAYVIDSAAQREAVQEELLDRITAIAELSETAASAQLDSRGPRSHAGILEAVAILSRDVRGLLEASFDPGP